MNNNCERRLPSRTRFGLSGSRQRTNTRPVFLTASPGPLSALGRHRGTTLAFAVHTGDEAAEAALTALNARRQLRLLISRFSKLQFWKCRAVLMLRSARRLCKMQQRPSGLWRSHSDWRARSSTSFSRLPLAAALGGQPINLQWTPLLFATNSKCPAGVT
jgi:hypothetical protein